MPEAIVPLVGLAAGGLASSAIGAAVGGGIIGGIVGSIAGGLVSAGVSYLGSKAFGKDASSPTLASVTSLSADVTGGGWTQMVQQPITTYRIVYGQTLVSGPIVYIHSRPISPSSDKLDMLHVVIVLAGHEVDSINDVYFDNTLVNLDGDGAATDTPYKQGSTVYATIYKHLGSPDQVADSVLIANSDGQWTSAHRLRGLTYIHAMLQWNQTAYPNGLPNIAAIVKGKEVYDPRTLGTAWSDNSALCILDYVMADFGLNATLDEIDLDSFTAAANICDEVVDTIDGTEKRYTCNGVVDLGAAPTDILQNMLTSCAGLLTYTSGKWRLKVGAYTAPVYTLEPMHARDTIMFKPHRSRQNLINTVQGAFVSPDHQWQPTDYPIITNSAYVDQDNGETITSTLDLPFTQSPTMAQRIALISLEQNRRQKEVLFPANLVGFQLAAGQTIALNLPRMGLAGLPCTVTTWSMTEDLGVDLTLDEDGPEVYEFSVSDLQSLDASPEVVAPNNATVPPTAPANLEAEAGADFIHLSWDPVLDSDLRYVEVWESDATTDEPETDASRIMEVSGNELTRNDLPGGATRYYWVRSVDRYGNKSDFTGPVDATTSGDPSIVLVLE